MNKWCGVGVALLALACSGEESMSRATPATTPDTIPALQATRTDTLREEDGEIYSPSFTRFVLTRAGNVVAVDQDDKKLVLFDTSGRQQHAIGRNGAGPGEFRFPVGLFVLPGDSIAVWDAGLRRISIFDDTLKFVRTESFALWNFTGGQSELVGRFEDGRWIARIDGRAFNPDVEVGARYMVDSARLVAGRSNEAPSDLLQLRLRSGVDVTARMGSTSTNTHVLRLMELNLGVGAVCERGILTVDTSGVKVFDLNGRIVDESRLPRVGDSIRTAADRKKIVDDQFYGAMATDANAPKARELLDAIVRKFPARMIAPIVDASGRLWYTRFDENAAREAARARVSGSFGGRYIFEQLDSTGTPRISLSLLSNDPTAKIGDRSIAVMRHGSDTTGLTLLLAHVPENNLANRNARLGRCASSFTY